MKKIFKKPAQSTVEYVILFAVVVTVVVLAARTRLKQAVEKMMDSVANTIIESTNKIKDSL